MNPHPLKPKYKISSTLFKKIFPLLASHVQRHENSPSRGKKKYQVLGESAGNNETSSHVRYVTVNEFT